MYTITSDPFKISQLKKVFAKVNHFTLADIRKFYISNELHVREETLRSRVHRLIKMGVLQRIGQGIYKFGEEIIFVPNISTTTKKVYDSIHQNFPYANTCIWHTSTLNEFMVHQPFKFNMIVEVEKDASESVFYFIKEKFPNVFLNPGEEIYRNYISGKKESIIVKTLISEAPTQEIYNVITPTIEKILVDIYCDKVVFSTFQGKEMRNIFINSFEKYTVNLSTLYRYSQRRGKKEEIVAYIQRLKLALEL